MKTISLSTKAMKLEGVKQMIATLNDLAKSMNGEGTAAVTSQLKEAMMKPANTIKDEAVDLVPVVTGNLQAHIFAGELKDKIGALVGVKGVHYAPWVEYGTARQTAHPYFRPAINATRPLVANMISGDLKSVIDQICRNDAWHQSDATT